MNTKRKYLMEQQEVIDKVATIVKDYLSGQKENGFLHYKNPAELEELLQLEHCRDGADWPDIFRWIEKYLEYSVKTNNPGFVNRMWAGANLPSLVGEMIVAATNTSSCTYESAPVSSLMEKYMIREMLDLVGFTNGEGQMTTGSSNANMLAMMAARNEMLPKVKANGLFAETDIYGFVSGDAHYSMDKAANILGLGTNRLIKIPVTKTGEMDITILAAKLEETVADGGNRFLLVEPPEPRFEAPTTRFRSCLSFERGIDSGSISTARGVGP